MNRRARWVWCVLLAMLGVTSLRAHTLSESISSWQISAGHVRLQFIVPDLEAKRLSKTGDVVPLGNVIGAYLKEHVGASAAGKPCAIALGPRAMASVPGFSNIEFEFACSDNLNIKIHSSAFYEFVPSHVDFARIQDDAGHFYEELLTHDRQEVAITGADAGSPLRNAGLLEFVRLGMMHIFTGIDHMSFMLGLVLISRRVRDLLFVVTGFTIGHSLTLGLAVTGILRPDAQYIDALVVGRGETVASIARQYGSSVAVLTKINDLPAGRVAPGETLKIPSISVQLPDKVLLAASRVDRPETDLGGRKQHQIVYRVRAGETLNSIARRHGMPVSTLARLNNLGTGDPLIKGQRLVIKASARRYRDEGVKSGRRTLYTVRRGDTVFSISRQFQVSVVQLKSWNGLNKNHQIRAGQRLVMYIDSSHQQG